MEESGICPYIELPPIWDDYKSLLSRATRNNIRKYSNRLAKEGKGELIKVEDKSKISRAFDEFYRLQENYQQRKRNTDTVNLEAMRNFHYEVANKLHNYVTPFFLELNGKPIVGMYCYDYKGTRYSYGIWWDQCYAHCSPGFITITKVIQEAIDKRLQRFDFLRGEESYKFHFTKTKKINRVYFISHSKLKLRMFLLLQKLSRKKRMYINKYIQTYIK
jgi:CelD/BcsL family acetyltransferase involved in cellulose biosynthesis